MTKKTKTILLIIALIVCLAVLGVLIYLFFPKECKHHFCKKTPSDPTCDEKGYTLYECLTCDYTFEADFVAPLGHQYTDVVTAPLCDAEGYTTHTCSVCGIANVDTYISPKGHDFEATVIAPTCEGQGYTKQTCADCGFTKNTDYIKPLGHDLSGEKTAPTCVLEGYTSFSCSRCDHKYVSDYIDPTGHSISKTSTIAPTCIAEGYSIYTCANCEYEYVNDYVDPTGHSVNVISTVSPTCLEEGHSTYQCSNCNYEYVGDRVVPTGHTLSQTTVAPTCTSEGYTAYSCSNCTYTYNSDSVAPVEHTYEKTYVRPNIAQTGYTIYTCTVCGSESIADYVFYSDIFGGAEGEGRGSLGFGLDLSHHSGNVDFAALKAAGVDFVILRVGYNTSLDTKFEEYYAAAREAGLDIGVYFFTLAENKDDAIADATRVAGWLEGKKLEYPVFYDVEDDPAYSGYAPSTFSEAQIMEIAHTFMTEMVNHGYYPGLYTNNNFLYNTFNNEKTLRLYDVWYARYNEVTDERITEYSGLYSMWQYEGNVAGYENGAVEGMCDLNYTFKNYPEIMIKFGFNGYQ